MGRQDVIDALIDRLSTITVDNGYDTDIGANVQSMYELEIDTDEDLPLINVRESDSDVPLMLNPLWQHECPVEITILAVEDIEYIRQAANDVLKCIGADTSISETCVDVIPESVTVRKAEKGEPYAEAEIKITLKYLTNEWEV